MITFPQIGYMGRLGNQIFQFASTLGIADKLGKEAKFPIENCFNYNILGVNGFNCVSDLVNDSDCFNLEYSSLNETLLLLTDLSD